MAVVAITVASFAAGALCLFHLPNLVVAEATWVVVPLDGAVQMAAVGAYAVNRLTVRREDDKVRHTRSNWHRSSIENGKLRFLAVVGQRCSKGRRVRRLEALLCGWSVVRYLSGVSMILAQLINLCMRHCSIGRPTTNDPLRVAAFDEIGRRVNID